MRPQYRFVKVSARVGRQRPRIASGVWLASQEGFRLKFWVAVQELNVSYQNKDIYIIYIYVYMYLYTYTCMQVTVGFLRYGH